MFKAAAFGRLCVETCFRLAILLAFVQPPSGGCVLKRPTGAKMPYNPLQPPSGGCVLKQYLSNFTLLLLIAAAFGRLCVETCDILEILENLTEQPPSGGCVLKL